MTTKKVLSIQAVVMPLDLAWALHLLQHLHPQQQQRPQPPKRPSR